MVSPALPPSSWVEPLVRAGSLSEPVRQLAHFTPGLGELLLYWKSRRNGARGMFLDLLTLGTKDVSRVPPEVIEANVSMIAARMEASPLGHAQSYLDATRSMLLHLARSERVHADAEAVRAPTLVLHGAEDRLVPVEFSREFVARHPSFALEVLDDVGHVPQMEDAERFVERVAGFLRRNGIANEPIEEAPSSRVA
jgi:glycerol-3-phosphate dehydrogenase